jgi:hypothetical protein
MLVQILENEAFSLASMSKGIQTVEPLRQPLGDSKLFMAEPIRTDTVYIEKEEGKGLKLIKPSARGEKIERRNKSSKRNLVSLVTDRYALFDQIEPSELQFIRAFETTEQQVEGVQSEIAKRQMSLLKDAEATFEHQRLGAALQGIVIDSEGDVIYDFFERFGYTKGSELELDLSLTDGNMRVWITENIHRYMMRSAKGATFSAIKAYCGSAAMDKLSKNPEYRAALLAQGEVGDTKDGYFGQAIKFGGVEWIEYFGTDDDKINLGVDEVRFIPGGTNDVYRHIQSPDESFESVGQLGQEFYSWLEWDKASPGRTQWVKTFLATYSLFVNTRPDLIRKAVAK